MFRVLCPLKVKENLKTHLEENFYHSRALAGEVVSGMRAALPVVVGYLAVGLVAGVVLRTAGFTVAEVALMSLVLYAGSAQLIVARLLSTGATFPLVLSTVFLTNLRHLLYSSSVAPLLRALPIWKNVLIGLELTDETYAVAADYLRKHRPARAGWLFGLNGTAHAAWIGSTTVGAFAGDTLSRTQALGLDYALTAMFAALVVLSVTSQPRKRLAIVVGVISAGVAVGGTLLVPSSLAIIAAAVIAATAGTVLEWSDIWK